MLAAQGGPAITGKSALRSLSGQQKQRLNLTMANGVAEASTKGQVMQIGLFYPQQSSAQKLISLFPLKKLIFTATVNLKQSDAKKKNTVKIRIVLFIYYT